MKIVRIMAYFGYVRLLKQNKMRYQNNLKNNIDDLNVL